MKLYSSKYPHKSETANELNDWSVLIRVGEDEWRVAARSDGFTDNTAQNERETAATTDVLQHGKARSSVYLHQQERGAHSLKKALGDWFRRQYQKKKDSVREALDPLFMVSGVWPDGTVFPKTQAPLRDTDDISLSKVRLGHSVRSEPHRGRRFLRDSLQLGLVAGLVLGCTSLVLFHLLPQRDVISTASQPSPTQATTPIMGSRYITLPAIQVYLLQTSPIPTRSEAVAQSRKLQNRGIWTAVINNKHGYFLVASASFHASSLKSLQAKLKNMGYTFSPESVDLSVSNLQAARGAPGSDMNAISQWLTLALSSLNTINGSVMEDEALRDAQVAYAAAVSQTPSNQILAESGYQKQLTDFRQRWESAFSALEKQKKDVAEENCVAAYLDLIALHGEG